MLFQRDPKRRLEEMIHLICGEATTRDEGKRLNTLKRLINDVNTYGERKGEGIYQQMAAGICHSLTSSDWEALVDSQIRTLILVGDQDAVIRPSNSHYIASKLGVEAVVFEGGGHTLLFEMPDTLNSLLVSHFDQHEEEAEKGREEEEEEGEREEGEEEDDHKASAITHGGGDGGGGGGGSDDDGSNDSGDVSIRVDTS